MIIVAGHLVVDPDRRADYLADSATVVGQARQTRGCLDFSLSADPLDAGRIVVFERWETRADVEAFRGSGPDADRTETIHAASVAEYDIAGVRSLT